MSGPPGYPMGQQPPHSYPHNYPMGTAPFPGQRGCVPPQPGYVPPPPGQPGYVPPPPGQPGYGPPPPGQPGYAPPGQPGYGPPPPPGQPGYGPPGQPGYGPAPGHPNFAPPGYLPPGAGVPPGAAPPYGVPPPAYGPGYAPGVPPGGAASYPHGAPHYPPGSHGGRHSTGDESDDSQPGDPGLRSRGNQKRIKCTFVNHADAKIILSCIDERGKLHKVCRLRDGKKEVIDTFEGHVFVARGRGRKKRRRSYVINNNVLYAVTAEDHGDGRVKAEIREGPDRPKHLESEKGEVAVTVKFINRCKKTVQLVWINQKGKREKKKVIAPGRCFKTKSYECQYWIAHDVQNEDEEVLLNYAFFYSPWKTKKAKERVLITDHKPWKDSSSSSSSNSD